MPAVVEVKKGFYVGLGVAAALAVWSLLQLMFAKAANRG